MKILSIETSCDETAISVMETRSLSFKILANNVSSQIKVHAPYGGVFPALAKREHIKNLPVILEKTLREAKLDKKTKPVDLIAVTSGPGLEPALWTGIVFAQELAKKWKVPLIPVNHMEGHIFSVFPKSGKKTFSVGKTNFPILTLLVSGGHTELVLIKKWFDYKIIGETLDDAVGEAFDKTARLLGLPYPGGPEISKLAEQERKKQINFLGTPFSLPRPMLHTKDFNFSYSGLKTAVLYLVKKLGKLKDAQKKAIALEFENAAIECLTHKTLKAATQYKTKTLIVAGGVSANRHLRSEIQNLFGQKALFPIPELTGDNSLMIGIAGYMNFIKNKKEKVKPESIKAVGNLRLK